MVLCGIYVAVSLNFVLLQAFPIDSNLGKESNVLNVFLQAFDDFEPTGLSTVQDGPEPGPTGINWQIGQLFQNAGNDPNPNRKRSFPPSYPNQQTPYSPFVPTHPSNPFPQPTQQFPYVPPRQNAQQVLQEKYLNNYFQVSHYMNRWDAAEQAAWAAATTTTPRSTTTTTTPKPTTTPSSNGVLTDFKTGLSYIPQANGKNMVVNQQTGQPEKINGIQIYLDLSKSIPYVSLQDGKVTRSVVIDMQIVEPKLINGIPVLFDTNTGRTYLQNTSVGQTSPIAYELVDAVTGEPVLKDGKKVYISVDQNGTNVYYFTNPNNFATRVRLNPTTLQPM